MRLYALAIIALSLCCSCTSKDPQILEREGQPPVSKVTADDAEMNAAIQKGKDTLPEFIAEITKHPPYPGMEGKAIDVTKLPAPETAYTVKVAYPAADDSVEHIWVFVSEYKAGIFHGVLANEPVNLPSMKLGQPVEVKRDDVEDWIITDKKGAMRGGFTSKLLHDRDRS